MMTDKKALKGAYKQMVFKMGVFQLKNKVNGKILIGGHTNIDAIWNRHCFELDMGAHRNKPLQQDWNEVGADNFEFSLIEELKHDPEALVDYQEEVKALEEMYLESLQPYGEKGYHRKPKR